MNGDAATGDPAALIDELRGAFLTGALSDDQLADLIAVGDTFEFVTGDELFREGEPADHLWILLVGHIELYRASASETTVIMTMDTPGQWAGGLRAWGDASLGAGYRASGRAASAGHAFRVPSEDLGRLVEEWFPFGKHMINGVYQTIRNLDAMARQRESLVALGTLAAGLAHEINNPAAASLRAVEGLRAEWDSMLSSLVSLAEQSITADQFVAIDALRRGLAEREVSDDGALGRMDREDAIGDWLSQHHVDDPWQLAPAFASAGADPAWFDEVAAVTGSDALSPALGWAASTISAAGLLDELTDTTNRISNLVAAVSSYSQLDRTSLRQVDVHEGIDSTLTMLSQKLRDIRVERAFGDDVVEIGAYGAELNQVWTNLIDNAIDAMDGVGTLRIETRLDGQHVVVDIVDSGGGMPADVQARIFEPFFTTKDVGKGTGLGLDIARRVVVERHNGTIELVREGDETVARIRLPR